MKQPLVSIITVVYNGDKHLQQTIDSVYNQTYKNIEYIIIDGHSTDNTLAIINQNNDKITYWISEPDNGLYDAMNKGVLMAKGELIGTINSDDWYEKDAVQLSVNAYLNNTNAKIIHADRFDVYKNETKKIFRFNTSVFKFKYYKMTYSHPTMFISKEIYAKHQYNIKLKSYADYQFLLELYLQYKNHFAYTPKPIVNFRLGGISGQINFFEGLKEAFISRKNAGLSIAECIFSSALTIISHPLVFLKNRIIK